MPFVRIIVGWAVVVAVFLAWRELEFRKQGVALGQVRAPLRPILIEAGLFVLFAALWFGSLGSGGGWILFPLLGALIDLPGRLRQQAAGVPMAWGAAISAILRITVPGILLGFVLA